MGLLDGREIVITGVLTDRSIATAVCRAVLAHGAKVVVTGAGRGLATTRRTVARLGAEVPVVELDVTDPAQLASFAERVSEHLSAIDGLLHAIAFAPSSALGDDLFQATPAEVATTLATSATSLADLIGACLPLLRPPAQHRGASIVALDFDATRAWPHYGWMGIAKGALEALTRSLAVQLGAEAIRVNVVASGPLRTAAARQIPGFGELSATWDQRAPLGWDPRDSGPVGDACVALFSDLLASTTGQVLYVDGGVHAVGA